MNILKLIGLIIAIILPFWNIPLILRIQRRGSSEDISLFWAVGVWACLALLLPANLISSDLAFKLFGVINYITFSLVMIYVLKYRKVDSGK